MRNIRYLFNRGSCAGRRLCVHHSNRLDFACSGERLPHALRIHSLPHLMLDRDDVRSAALRDLPQPLSEVTVDSDNERIARLDDVHHRGFHPGGAGAGDRQRHRILRPEYVAQQRAYVVHHGEEVRVQVSNERGRHRLQYARVHVGWACSHEQPVWRHEASGVLRHTAFSTVWDVPGPRRVPGRKAGCIIATPLLPEKNLAAFLTEVRELPTTCCGCTHRLSALLRWQSALS